MNARRTTGRIAATLGAVALVLAASPAARAGMIPSAVTVTPGPGGVFNFSYTLQVLGTSQVQDGDYAVIYDVPGYVAGSAVAAVAGWTAVAELTTAAPPFQTVADSEALYNVVWTYRGDTLSPGNTTLFLTGFGYQSTFGDVGLAQFSAQTHLDPDTTGGVSFVFGNSTEVEVPRPGTGDPGDPAPSEAPEPATLLLCGLAFPLTGLAALVRRRMGASVG